MQYKHFLTVKGKIKTVKVDHEEEEKFDWCGSVADAGILAGLAFFTCLVGTNIMDIMFTQSLYASGISAAVQFFTLMALTRGITQKETNN